MQCKDIELVLEQEGLEPLPDEARAHLAECVDCRSYVADLTALVDVANKLPAEVAPPERVWVSLRAQLEAEGVIRQPGVEAARPASWWSSMHAFFSNRVLATSTVGIVIVAVAVFLVRSEQPRVGPPQAARVEQTPPIAPIVRPADQPAKGPGAGTPGTAPSRVTAPAEFASTAQALDDQEPVATGLIASSNSTIDASLRENLQKVNEFIADCERHLKEQPQDELTREYLTAAYEQKAELLSAIIERGRSIN